MQTGMEAPGRGMGFEFFDDFDVESVARTAAQRAVSLLAAVPAPSGQMAVVLKRGRSGWSLVAAGEMPLPEGSLQDGAAAEPTMVSGAVGDLLDSLKKLLEGKSSKQI